MLNSLAKEARLTLLKAWLHPLNGVQREEFVATLGPHRQRPGAMGSQTSEGRAITRINVQKCTHTADHSRSTLCGGKKVGGGHCEVGGVVRCEVGSH